MDILDVLRMSASGITVGWFERVGVDEVLIGQDALEGNGPNPVERGVYLNHGEKS